MKPSSSRRFEWLFLLSSCCFTYGLFLDGWAHNHLSSALETFFTPWHAVFYAGFFLCVVTLLAWLQRNRQKRLSWSKAIPAGHGLSLIGLEIFFLGGLADMAWHLQFGVEADIEALLSPTHLVLATGMILILSGGMRHFWATHAPSDKRTFAEAFPLICSLTLSIAVVLFMTQFAHYTDFEVTGLLPKDTFHPQALSVSGILLFSIALIGGLSLPLRREALPFGTVTFLLTALVCAFGLMRSGTELLPAALLAGMTGDLIASAMPPTAVTRIRGFSFLVPFVFYACAFPLLMLSDGIWWSVHMWAGAPFLAGFAGLLISFVGWPLRDALTERKGVFQRFCAIIGL